MSLGYATNEKVNDLTSLDFIAFFISKGLLKLEVPSDPLFQGFLNNTNVLNEKSNLRGAYNLAQKYNFDFQAISYQLLLSVIIDRLTNIFSQYKIEQQRFDNGIDIIVGDREEKNPDLLVQFKFIRQGNLAFDQAQLVRALVEYNGKSKKGNYLVLIVIHTVPPDIQTQNIYKFNLDVRDTLISRKHDEDLGD